MLIIFSFNAIGCYLVVSIQKYEARREMLQHIKAHIPDSELVHIELTFQNKNEFHWKEANEFNYKGVMYDIVKIEKSDVGTIYHCIADHREMELLKQLEIQINKDKSTKNNKNNLAKNLIKILPKIESQTESDSVLIHVPEANISTEALQFYNSIKLEFISPPPRFI